MLFRFSIIYVLLSLFHPYIRRLFIYLCDIRGNSRSIYAMIKFKDFKVYNAISPIEENKTVYGGTLYII